MFSGQYDNKRTVLVSPLEGNARQIRARTRAALPFLCWVLTAPSLRGQQVAVNHVVLVKVVSRNLPLRVDWPCEGALTGRRARAWSIGERGDVAATAPGVGGVE